MKIIAQITGFVINVLEVWSPSIRKRYGWYRFWAGSENGHTIRSTKKSLFFFYKRSRGGKSQHNN